MKKFFLLFVLIFPIFCFLSINQTISGNLLNCAFAEEPPSIDITISASPDPANIDTTVTITVTALDNVARGFSKVRHWMATQSWEDQYRFGIEIWKQAMRTGGNIIWTP